MSAAPGHTSVLEPGSQTFASTTADPLRSSRSVVGLGPDAHRKVDDKVRAADIGGAGAPSDPTVRIARPRGTTGTLPGTVELIGRAEERAALDRFLAALRGGESQALVLLGEPGVGKTALLEDLAAGASGCRVVSVSGVQSEMELAFAGLHRLCAPLLDRLDAIPAPQALALRTTFGMGSGPVPDRLVVGLAVLSLLAEAAAHEPLLCLVDDDQWLDRASVQVIAFAARRLGAESVGLAFGTRAWVVSLRACRS